MSDAGANGAPRPNADQVFSELQATLDREPQRISGVAARYQFQLTGDGGGEWTMVVADGSAHVERGRIDDAQTTVTMDTGDFIAMCIGELDGTDAFMSGKLKVSGDPFLGMRLAEIMRRDD